MARQLEVWLLGAHIGTLAQIDGRLGFSYAADWLAKGATTGGAKSDTTPLSQSLPLRAEPFDDRASRPFFAESCPGDKRRLIARRCISPPSDFALLNGIGGECAGIACWRATPAPDAPTCGDSETQLRLLVKCLSDQCSRARKNCLSWLARR